MRANTVGQNQHSNISFKTIKFDIRKMTAEQTVGIALAAPLFRNAARKYDVYVSVAKGEKGSEHFVISITPFKKSFLEKLKLALGIRPAATAFSDNVKKINSEFLGPTIIKTLRSAEEKYKALVGI